MRILQNTPDRLVLRESNLVVRSVGFVVLGLVIWGIIALLRLHLAKPDLVIDAGRDGLIHLSGLPFPPAERQYRAAIIQLADVGLDDSGKHHVELNFRQSDDPAIVSNSLDLAAANELARKLNKYLGDPREYNFEFRQRAEPDPLGGWICGSLLAAFMLAVAFGMLSVPAVVWDFDRVPGRVRRRRKRLGIATHTDEWPLSHFVSAQVIEEKSDDSDTRWITITPVKGRPMELSENRGNFAGNKREIAEAIQRMLDSRR